MSKPDTKRGINRRTVLWRCLAGTGAAGLGLAAGPARSVPFGKVSKAEAAYIDVNQPPLRLCEQCENFIKPNECEIVEGEINPNGTCDFFSG